MYLRINIGRYEGASVRSVGYIRFCPSLFPYIHPTITNLLGAVFLIIYFNKLSYFTSYSIVYLAITTYCMPFWLKI